MYARLRQKSADFTHIFRFCPPSQTLYMYDDQTGMYTSGRFFINLKFLQIAKNMKSKECILEAQLIHTALEKGVEIGLGLEQIKWSTAVVSSPCN